MKRIMPLQSVVLLAPLFCLMLAGCLTTPRSVFDAMNSMPAGESQAFMAFVESWEQRIGTTDSPRKLIDHGLRVMEIDGQALVEDVQEDGSADHYLVGRMGGRPVTCVLSDRDIEALAARHGVTLTVERESPREPNAPSRMNADGTDAALVAFMRDAFTNADLDCNAPSRGG